MKWKFNIVKTITTPVEIEAESFPEALKKVHNLNYDEVDTDHGEVNYLVDTTPSDSLIKWANY